MSDSSANVDAVKIAVVLSTYNGDTYLAEQLDSIRDQVLPDNVSLKIFARDDGSNDATVDILRRYASVIDMSVLEGVNLGVVPSFFEALSMVDSSYDYIALCDQDDRWHVDKLSRALEKLAFTDSETPALYCSEYIFSDRDLRPIEKSRLNKIGVSLDRLLYENVISGNTIVFNGTLLNTILSAGKSGVYCHDWWIALLAAALGTICFDSDFYSLDYRRTGENASATGVSALGVLSNRVKRFVFGGELKKVTLQLEKLHNILVSSEFKDSQALVNSFLSGSRLKKAFYPHRLRQSLLGELALRILFLGGFL